MSARPASTAPTPTTLAPFARLFKGAPGRVFLLLCLMYFIEYVDRVNLSVAAPILKHELALSNTQLGIALSAFGYCYALFQIIGGFAGDRLGGRITLTACGTLWAVGTCLTGIAGGLVGLVLARCLVGLGEAGTLPTSSRVIAHWIPAQRRGFAQGFTHTSARLAAALTPPIVVMMIPLIGWRGTFQVLGAISVLWVLIWALYFHDDPRRHRGVGATDLMDLPPYAPRPPRVTEIPWLPLVKRILPVTLVFFCHAWTLWLYLSWLPSFLTETYHLALSSTSLFSSGVFFAGMIGDTAGGLLTDAIFRRTGDVVKARRNAVIIGFGGALLFLVPVLRLHSPIVVTLSLAAALFFLETAEGPIWAVPIDVAAGYAGIASGIMSTAAGLAAVVSPIAFGLIADLTGSYRLPFALSIALLGCGIGLAFFMRPDRTVPARNAASAMEASS